MTLSFPWLRFFFTKLFTFYSLQHHVHIRHRRHFDEQKAVVVVKHHYQSCQLNAKRTSSRKCLGTYVQVRLTFKGDLKSSKSGTQLECQPIDIESRTRVAHRSNSEGATDHST